VHCPCAGSSRGQPCSFRPCSPAFCCARCILSCGECASTHRCRLSHSDASDTVSLCVRPYTHPCPTALFTQTPTPSRSLACTPSLSHPPLHSHSAFELRAHFSRCRASSFAPSLCPTRFSFVLSSFSCAFLTSSCFLHYLSRPIPSTVRSLSSHSEHNAPLGGLSVPRLLVLRVDDRGTSVRVNGTSSCLQLIPYDAPALLRHTSSNSTRAIQCNFAPGA
jgi:hypothetical protein